MKSITTGTSLAMLPLSPKNVEDTTRTCTASETIHGLRKKTETPKIATHHRKEEEAITEKSLFETAPEGEDDPARTVTTKLTIQITASLPHTRENICTATQTKKADVHDHRKAFHSRHVSRQDNRQAQ